MQTFIQNIASTVLTFFLFAFLDYVIIFFYNFLLFIEILNLYYFNKIHLIFINYIKNGIITIKRIFILHRQSIFI